MLDNFPAPDRSPVSGKLPTGFKPSLVQSGRVRVASRLRHPSRIRSFVLPLIENHRFSNRFATGPGKVNPDLSPPFVSLDHRQFSGRSAGQKLSAVLADHDIFFMNHGLSVAKSHAGLYRDNHSDLENSFVGRRE